MGGDKHGAKTLTKVKHKAEEETPGALRRAGKTAVTLKDLALVKQTYQVIRVKRKETFILSLKYTALPATNGSRRNDQKVPLCNP